MHALCYPLSMTVKIRDHLETQLAGECDVLSVMFLRGRLFFHRPRCGGTNCAAPVLHSTRGLRGLYSKDTPSQTTQSIYIE